MNFNGYKNSVLKGVFGKMLFTLFICEMKFGKTGDLFGSCGCVYFEDVNVKWTIILIFFITFVSLFSFY